MQIDQTTFEHLIIFKSIKNPFYMGAIVDYLDVGYFSNPNVKKIISLIQNFYREYNKIPSLMELKLFLKDDSIKKAFKEVVSTFSGLDDSVDDEILLKETEKFLREKAVYSTMLEVAENIKEYSHSQILEKFEKSCGITLITEIGHDYFRNIEEHIKWLQSDQEKISTGYDFFDQRLRGGFNKDGRAMYVFLGATNSCKSVLLANLSVNCVNQGYSMPIVTLEMGEQFYAQRMSSMFSDIPIDCLKHEIADFRKTIDGIKQNNPDCDLILKEFAPGQLSVSGLDAYLTQLKKRGYKMDIVFLDYITLMKSEGQNLYERGKNLAEQTRALSYKHGVSFVTVIQANRSGITGQPQLDNTSESMGIAHTADFIASIWREDEDIETNTLRGGILKNRIGENFGTHMFELNPQTLRLVETENLYDGDENDMEKQLKEQINELADISEFIK